MDRPCVCPQLLAITVLSIRGLQRINEDVRYPGELCECYLRSYLVWQRVPWLLAVADEPVVLRLLLQQRNWGNVHRLRLQLLAQVHLRVSMLLTTSFLAAAFLLAIGMTSSG